MRQERFLLLIFYKMITLATLLFGLSAQAAGLPGAYSYPPFTKPQPPKALVSCLELVQVEFYGYNGKLQRGELVVNKDLADDIRKIFALIKEIRFPVKSVQAVQKFGWSDEASMAADNTSAYNYREITGGGGLSLHALGRAVDLNPFCNPYMRGTLILPRGARYDSQSDCALESEKGRKVVKAFLELGWRWGGNGLSGGVTDYQHFDKLGPNGREAPYCGN